MSNQNRREAISKINQPTLSDQEIIESRAESNQANITPEINQFHIITKLNRILAIDSNNCFVQEFKNKVAQGDYDYYKLYELDGGNYCLEDVLHHIYIRVQNQKPSLINAPKEILKPDIEVWLSLLNS